MSLSQKTCIPCQANIPALSVQAAENQLTDIPNWKLNDSADKISRKYAFKNFMTALDFVNKTALICEEQNHHPDIIFGWGYVHIVFYTHKIKGLHENDFIMAAKCDNVFDTEQDN